MQGGDVGAAGPSLSVAWRRWRNGVEQGGHVRAARHAEPAARPAGRYHDGGVLRADVEAVDLDDGDIGPSPVEMPMPGPILSRTTVNAVESAFNTLAHTVLSNNARTLEDLVKEMLRPMLKSWLDDNLPGLVERIVKAEIERVSRGR